MTETLWPPSIACRSAGNAAEIVVTWGCTAEAHQELRRCVIDFMLKTRAVIAAALTAYVMDGPTVQ